MIDIKALENPNLKHSRSHSSQKVFINEYKENLKDRKVSLDLLERLLELNSQRKTLIQNVESLKSKQNTMGESLVSLKKREKEDKRELKDKRSKKDEENERGETFKGIMEEMRTLSVRVKKLKDKIEKTKSEIDNILLILPNSSHKTVPEGVSEKENQIVRTFGEMKGFPFKVREHSKIGKELDGFDFQRASKVTGARFTFLKKKIASMERALIQYMMDLHTQEHKYEEIAPPYLVNTRSLFHSGHFPKFKDDVFSITNTDFHLIPTAEVPLTNYFSGEILKEEDLPKAFVAYTPCFRSEAGSYGRDTKGLIRQHQFNKVELFYFSLPENSFEILEKLTSHAEEVLKRLELPYRVMNLCRGELGFSAAKCYDLEVWLPGQKAYREISSCSNCLDFQARRAGIRFRPSSRSSKPRFVHTLNGSALAVGRTLIAIIENYQQDGGRILVPKVLQKILGCKEIS